MPVRLRSIADFWAMIKGDAVASGDGTTDTAPARYDHYNQDIGAKDDAVATNNTGTFSLIALFKRLLNFSVDPVIFTANLVLDTAIYADADVFSDLLEITNAVKAAGRKSKIISLIVNDESDQGFGIEFFFFDRTITLTTKNSTWAVSDADMRNCLGMVQVTSGDFTDIGGNRICTFSALDLPIEANSGTSIYLATRIRGAGTYATNGVSIKVGIDRY